MKSTFVRLSLFFFILCIILAVTVACGDEKENNRETVTTVVNETEHIHSFKDQWSCDKEEHWRASACDHPYAWQDRDKHQWDEGEVEYFDCNSAGQITKTCQVCGYQLKTPFSPSGHVYSELIPKVDPTCVEPGMEAHYSCTQCDTYFTESLSAISREELVIAVDPDAHDLTHHDAKAPTCTEGGWDAYVTCSKCDHTTYVELPATGHSEVEHDAKAPTCTEIGWDAYVTCSRCDYTTYSELAALGHKPAEAVVENRVEPTCTVAGHYDSIIYCSVCKAELSRETISITAPGHDEVHHDAKAPTCTEIGWDAYVTCSKCDHTTYVELPAIGHSYGNLIPKVDTTCVSAGFAAHYFCDICDTYFTSDIKPTTREELVIAVDPDAHDLTHHDAKAPTCTEGGWAAYDTCKLCSYSTYADLSALGHTAGNWQITVAPTITAGGEQVKKCIRCGLVMETAALPAKTAVELTVSANSTAFGTVAASKTKFDPDTPGDATVTATPANGYHFFGWFDGDMLLSRETSYTFAMPTKDYALTARFSKQNNAGGQYPAEPDSGSSESADVWDGSTATAFAGGSGTASDPYQIATGAQLALMRDRINTRNNTYSDDHYILTADLDLGGRDWQPIGIYYYSSGSYDYTMCFRGVFDGQGHVIFNYKVVAQNSYERYFGLFGFSGGTIRNLGVEDYTLSILDRSTYVCGGGLVGNSSGTITDCYATGDVTVSSSYDDAYGGGLVGYNDSGTITNCYATGNVTVTTSGSYSYAYGGGLVGDNYDGTITGCYATGDVTVGSSSSRAYGGGLVGSSSGTITGCYATGDVTVSSSSFAYGGGLVGSSSGTITNCYAKGDVTVTTSSSSYHAYGGGLVGGNFDGTIITNCYATGNVTVSSSSSYAYGGGLVGYNNSGTITNCYRYEGQVITENGSSSSPNSYGTACTLAQLNSAAFYTDTLGWDASVWYLSGLDLEAGYTPALTASITEGKIYYQLFVTSTEHGSVNISEHIVADGASIVLIGQPDEGYEVAVWLCDGKVVGEGNVLRLAPTASMNIEAVFDLIKYSVLVEAEAGLTIPAYSRYYKDAAVTLTATLADGYTFDGWFVGDEQVCDALSYSFTMPGETYRLEARSTPIDYQLTVTVTNAAAGSASLTEQTFHVTDGLTVTYTLNSGYRFVGWYRDGQCVSSELSYAFPAPAADVRLEARTEAIDYSLSAVASTGGRVTNASGTYHVGDTVHLTATPDATYEFIGWYSGDQVISYRADYTYTMPADDVRLAAKFRVGIVYVNAVPGFNGTAAVTGESKLIIGESTVLTAKPNDGYVFVGWYSNDVLVSTDEIYRVTYETSGTYSLYASFAKAELRVTYNPQNGDAPFTEIITDRDTYLMPYAYREGYTFDGWYTSPNGNEKLVIATDSTAYADYRAYGKWTQLLSVSQIDSPDNTDYTVTVYSRENLLDTWAEHIECNTLNGSPITLTVRKSMSLGAGYYTLSASFSAGESYMFTLRSKEAFFVDRQGQTSFALSFARPEIAEYTYQSNLRAVSASDIVSLTGTGMVLRSPSAVLAGDIIYCADENFEILKRVEIATLTGVDEYTLVFSAKEVDLSEVFQTIDVNAPEMDLGDAVEIGNAERALAAFAEMGMELASVNALYGQLNALAAETDLFRFENPQATPKLTYKSGVITGSLEITVDGKRYSPSGEELDQIRIRVYLELKNELSTSSDVALHFGFLTTQLERFKFEAINTTTLKIEVDAIYANKDAAIDYNALKTILSDYEKTLNDKKDMPFDTESKYEHIFDDFKIEFTVPLIKGVLEAKIQVTPFLRYQVIGQIDINTEFSMTNSATLVYTDGGFKLYYNFSTDKDISVYALAYLNIEAGIALNLQVRPVILSNQLNVGANFELGRYVTASGVLVYEHGNGNLAGFVEYGKFYDWDVYYTLFSNSGEYDPAKVSEPIATAGSYYLYLEFADADDEYILDEYVINIYDSIDHEAFVFNLKNLTPDKGTMDPSEYSYQLEENDYIYIDELNQLRVKHVPDMPITVKLTIQAGFNTVKIVAISFHLLNHPVYCSADSGTVSANVAAALTGQPVTFIYTPPTAHTVVDHWEINGEYINSTSLFYTCFMNDDGLDVRVVTTEISDVIYIYTVADFLNIQNGLDKTYVQMADLDFSGLYYRGLGDEEHPFTGTYYGNGYEIRNINYSEKIFYNGDSGTLIFSLFAIAENAEFNGITVRNASAIHENKVAAPSKYHAILYSGAVVGYGVNVTFQNCHVTDFRMSLQSEWSDSSFIKTQRNLTIQAGGLAGLTHGVVAENCSVVGTSIRTHASGANGTFSYLGLQIAMERNIVGGLFGENYHDLRVRNCYVQVDIDATKAGTGDSMSFIGGIAGLITKSAGHTMEIEHCLIDINSTHGHAEDALVNAVSSFHGSDPTMNVFETCSRIAYVMNTNITSHDSYSSTEAKWNGLPKALSENSMYQESTMEVYGFCPFIWQIINNSIQVID